MIISLDIPEYSKEQGLPIRWEGDFVISAELLSNGEMHIKANRDGLISIAQLLLTMAQPEVPSHVHVHLDSYGPLEEGSVELIIEKL